MRTEVVARVRLDWSDPSHWSPTTADCRAGDGPTHFRDARGEAVHQSCAEAELAAERIGQTKAVITDERVPVRPSRPAPIHGRRS